MNPWNLAARELDVLDALVRLGIDKLIARELSIQPGTVRSLMWRIGTKMKLKSRVLIALEYARWKWAQGAAL